MIEDAQLKQNEEDEFAINFFQQTKSSISEEILQSIESDPFDIYGYTKEAFMIQTKIFKSNQSQAVRLSKAVAFPDDVKEVEIVIIGNSRVITPAKQSWDSWFDSPPASDDFMIDREQPSLQMRESLDD